jgi:hypothetical protein
MVLAVEEGLEINFLLEGLLSWSRSSAKLRSVIPDRRSQLVMRRMD